MLRPDGEKAWLKFDGRWLVPVACEGSCEENEPLPRREPKSDSGWKG